MKADELEARMRALEWFHTLAFPAGAWVILRVDGRRFSKLTEERFEKPFDAGFHGHMVQAATALLEEFQGAYAYTESDEISLLLPRGHGLWGRSLEKAVSLSAAIASGVFSLACGVAAAFDGRACVAALDEQVIDYFRWRQADAARCALNGWCYWTLRKAGRGGAEATEALRGKRLADKHELLFQAGINFAAVPAWQRRGTGLSWKMEPHAGRDPISGMEVGTARRRIGADGELPLGEEYGRFLAGMLAGAGGLRA